MQNLFLTEEKTKVSPKKGHMDCYSKQKKDLPSLKVPPPKIEKKRLSPPNTTSHMKLYKTGALKVPLINSLMVRPLEIFAMNIPVEFMEDICYEHTY